MAQFFRVNEFINNMNNNAVFSEYKVVFIWLDMMYIVLAYFMPKFMIQINIFNILIMLMF